MYNLNVWPQPERSCTLTHSGIIQEHVPAISGRVSPNHFLQFMFGNYVTSLNVIKLLPNIILSSGVNSVGKFQLRNVQKFHTTKSCSGTYIPTRMTRFFMCSLIAELFFIFLKPLHIIVPSPSYIHLMEYNVENTVTCKR